MTSRRHRTGPGGVRKGAGRPPLDVSRDVTKRLRLTAAEEAEQEAAAAREGLTWSDWARAAFKLALAKITPMTERN